jgi:RNA polymerase primary sigma factor
VGRDGESALGDLIEDRWVGSPVDAVIDSNVRDETANILKTLSPQRREGHPPALRHRLPAHPSD